MTDIALQAISPRFAELHSRIGRPSIAPEKLLRALLVQLLYSIRSERLLMKWMPPWGGQLLACSQGLR